MESKDVLRETLYQALLKETDASVRALLAESINQIARVDYPQNWPQLLPDILAQVESGERLFVLACHQEAFTAAVVDLHRHR
jgi:hypothetical protein